LRAIIGRFSADDVDFDVQAEALPGGVGGVNGGLALEGEGQASSTTTG